jgi:hypothetical protein
MKITNATLKKLDGVDPIQNSSNPPGYEPKTDDPVLLISDVVSNVCMAPVQQGHAPYDPSKAAARYKLAVATFNLAEGAEFEVPAEMVVELDRDIARCYPIIVAGQMHLLLK